MALAADVSGGNGPSGGVPVPPAAIRRGARTTGCPASFESLADVGEQPQVLGVIGADPLAEDLRLFTYVCETFEARRAACRSRSPPDRSGPNRNAP